MINVASLEQTVLSHDPFDYVIVDDFVPASAMQAVAADYPKIKTTGSHPLSETSYGPAFAELIADLNGPAFEQAIGKVFDLDLSQYFRVITVRGRVGAHDGGVHTDATWKIISVLLYLNERWDEKGGRLRLLRDEDVNHPAIEIVPKWGTLLAFRRSDRSWHGHLPAEGERRVVQVNWVTSQQMADRELRRHRRSAWLKRLLRPSTGSGRPERVEGHPERVEGHPERVEGRRERVEGRPERVEGRPK